jgi:hypothetical protein
VKTHCPPVQVTAPLQAIQGHVEGVLTWSEQFANQASWLVAHASLFSTGPPQQPSALAHSSALLGAVA